MNRGEFLRNASLLASAGLLAPYACTSKESTVRKNWGGEYIYKAKELHQPSDISEVVSLIRERGNSKALGSRHSFNGIADSPFRQISLRKLNNIISIDTANSCVTVQGGIRYEELVPALDREGYALHNLASLPSVSVAGACFTATHGSGTSNGNLATALRSIEFVSGNGERVRLSRENDGDVFNGVVVNLGALGIITEMTLDIQKTFNVRQNLFQNLPLTAVTENFDSIMSSGYSVSLFTDWQNNLISEVWIKRRTDRPMIDLGKEFYGGMAATKNLHPVVRFPADACTEQMGVEGKWYDRLPHFRIGALPEDGSEIQSEYFVPMKNAVDAILALTKKGDIIFPQLAISEIRTIAADDIWMSPCYHEPRMAIHFSWKANWAEVRKILPVIESELLPFKAVPHWGKTFTMEPPIVRAGFPKFDDFLTLAKKYDPSGKFRNEFLEQNIYSTI